MEQNTIQFQKGLSLTSFLCQYGTEAQCEQTLKRWRWPQGFVCPVCGHSEHCILNVRNLYQCNTCHHQTSLTSDTIFAHTKLPLTTWFLAMYFLTQQKNGISALELKRHLGVSYPTAWNLKHKLMQVMKETDDRRPLHGVIQLDDVYWGGERHGDKPGRGSPNKVPFVAAVATNLEGHPIAMRMSKVEGFRKAEITKWALKHTDTQAIVVSDGLACFSAVSEVGRRHYSVTTGGGPTSVTLDDFTWVNTMIGNVKNALTGTYHAINGKHLPRYLAEFCYRFNRRFKLEDMLPRLGQAAVRTPPMPFRFLRMAEVH
ncbi:MAG: IS1595 family transposase [Gammaproteobacteria bacterium]|nr:IS1595 family transposase [Gammaproteobacteria bacterium]